MFTLIPVLIGSSLILQVSGTKIPVASPSKCCNLLHQEFKEEGKVVFPTSSEYGTLNTYWAPSSQENPTCIFNPSNTIEVARAVKLFTSNSCNFAIRGGGHSYNPGWSSINNGVLVSLSKLNSVSYVSGSAVIGAGNRWGNVYRSLEPYGVTVVGGQNANVGVGGFLLGGGISFLSNDLGWGADNVRSYEVVLADGKIVNANKQEHPDLYRALKGGSSNFGVVTGFTLDTYKVKSLNAAGIYYPGSSNDAFLNAAFEYSISGADGDPRSHAVFETALNGNLELQGAAVTTYSDFTNLDTAPPKVLKPFLDGSIPYVLKQVAVQNGTLGDIGDVLNAIQTAGRRTTRSTLSIEFNLGLLKQFQKIWIDTAKGYHTAEGFECEFAFQPIGKKWIAAAKKNGGNTLGIESPVLLLWIQPHWTSANDDKKMHEFVDKVISKFEKAAGRKLEKFRYLNYGGPKQKVIESYGRNNVRDLKCVKKKYDPRNVFGTLVPGGFKIPGY